MLLNNFYNYQKGYILDSFNVWYKSIVHYSGSKPTYCSGNMSSLTIPRLLKTFSAVTTGKLSYLLGNGSQTTSSYVPNEGVIFGTGTTPPAADDYTLSGEIICGLTTSNTMVSYTSKSDDEAQVLTSLFTITNTTGEDFTIGEVGLLVNTYCYDSTHPSNFGYRGFLVERTVLDTPVTIPAGGVGQVTYTIRMDYTTT